MSYLQTYYKQSALLVKVLPFLKQAPCFALKGGTAINFFHQNMPRLSVDIDIAYLPLKARDQALVEINQTIATLARLIQHEHPALKVIVDKSDLTALPKMQIQEQGVTVKVEVNPVFRGSVFEPQLSPLCEKAQALFKTYIEILTTTPADLYAGKFCAALNRQHPRDLFDVKLFLEQGEITDEIRQAFIIYMASDRRPMHELLNPNIKPYAAQQQLHENEFIGMVEQDIHYDDLAGIIERLTIALKQRFTLNEKQFLLSLMECEPQWQLMPFTHLENLPALRWKLINIQKMDLDKRKQAYQALEVALQV